MFYNFRKNKKAFTLVELIVVIAIIAILGSVAGVLVFRYVDSTRESAAKTPLSSAKSVFEAFKLDGNGKTFKAYCGEVLEHPERYYVSVNDVWSKTSISSSDNFTVYYKSSDTGDYWGKLECKNGVFGDPGTQKSAPGTKYQYTA